MSLTRQNFVPPTVPALGELVPACISLAKRRAELGSELKQVESEIETIYVKLAGERTPIADRQHAQRDAYLDALIRGQESSATEPATDRARLQVLHKRRFDLTLAIEELKRREASARSEASALACERLKEPYSKTVADICEAAVPLYETWSRYQTLADQMNANEIMWTQMHPMPPNFLGSSPHESHLARYLKEAVQHGFFDAARLPADLRDR